MHTAGEDSEVRDQAAVTTPPQGLTAHNGGPRVHGVRQYSVDRGDETRVAHVARIRPEGDIPPNYVRRVGRHLAPAAELLLPAVVDTGCGEPALEHLTGYVRIAAAARSGPHIDQRSHTGAVQQSGQLRTP